MRLQSLVAVVATSLTVLMAPIRATTSPSLPARANVWMTDDERRQHSRYLAKLSVRNDCRVLRCGRHLGGLDKQARLTGNVIGLESLCGMTCAGNLHLTMRPLSEARWVELAHIAVTKPPMPSSLL